LSSLLILFANNILPIFLVAGSGYAMGKFLNVHPRPVSQLAFYIFSPCLIFNLLTTSQLNSEDVLRLSGFTIASILSLGALTLAVGQILRLERRLMMAVLLATMFSNAGNFGLSVNLFAFGEKALAYASLYFVIASILTYTVGVIIASLGSSGWKAALFSLFKVPVVYAVLLAVLFKGFGWHLPLPLNRSVTLLGNAAIPVLMVLLGLQLQQSQWSRHMMALGLTNVMRLLIGPALALSLSLVFGLQGEARQAGIIESAMPTAVVTTVLANEFQLDAGFITSVVVTSTLLSPLTITPLLAYLGA
jgi:malate permease and related proteins